MGGSKGKKRRRLDLVREALEFKEQAESWSTSHGQHVHSSVINDEGTHHYTRAVSQHTTRSIPAPSTSTHLPEETSTPDVETSDETTEKREEEDPAKKATQVCALSNDHCTRH